MVANQRFARKAKPCSAKIAGFAVDPPPHPEIRKEITYLFCRKRSTIDEKPAL
jgi:hypothetical protein